MAAWEERARAHRCGGGNRKRQRRLLHCRGAACAIVLPRTGALQEAEKSSEGRVKSAARKISKARGKEKLGVKLKAKAQVKGQAKGAPEAKPKAKARAKPAGQPQVSGQTGSGDEGSEDRVRRNVSPCSRHAAGISSIAVGKALPGGLRVSGTSPRRDFANRATNARLVGGWLLRSGLRVVGRTPRPW